MGSFLSKAGISNILLEADNHPRPHVGESMVMSSVRVFDEIGFLSTLETEGFVRKYGASWHEIGGREAAITFSEFPQEGIRQPYTYHVDRSKLDLLMLKHAQRLGTQVYQGATVKEVLFDGARARGEPETADYIHVYFLPVERGWAWQIPITDTITSIGIVAEKDVFRQFRGRPEDYFEHYVQSNKGLAQAMAGAVRLNDYKTEGDYSYSMNSFIGNGWVLIGDAARFVDPIFSSGVSIALYSAKYASEQIR